MDGISYNKKSILEKYDTEPTADSKNAVTSEGIKQYVDATDGVLNGKIETLNDQIGGRAFFFKGSSTYAALIALPEEDNKVNDTYYVTDSDKMCWYTWNGSAWVQSSMNQAAYAGVIAQLRDTLAKTYDNTATYEVGQFVINPNDNLIYVCKTPINTAESWTAAHWENVEVISDVFADQVIVSDTQPTTATNKIWLHQTTPEGVIVPEMEDIENIVASKYNPSSTYTVGQYCIYNDLMWKCTTAIETSENWEPNHWQQVSAGSEITNVNNALSSEDTFVNDTLSFVNYGYDTPFYLAEDPSGSGWEEKTGIKRDGVIVELNKSTTSQYNIRIKISGSVELAASNAEIDAWATGITLQTDHEYLATVKLLSGTSYESAVDDGLTPQLYVFKAGHHTTQGATVQRVAGLTQRNFTAEEGVAYNLVLSIASSSGYYTNAKFLITLEDLTESQIVNTSMIIDKYDSSKTYSAGDYCIYSDDLYKCTTAITTSEAWNVSHWTKVQIGRELGNLKSAIHDVLAERYEDFPTWAVGRFCIYNDKIYRCVVAITEEEAFNADHWLEVPVCEGVFDNTNSAEWLSQDIKPFTTPEAINWEDVGTSSYPLGWRKGYYRASDGEMVTGSNFYICSTAGVKANDNVIGLYIYAPPKYGVSIVEYNAEGFLVKPYGTYGSTTGRNTEVMRVSTTPGYIYKFNLGRFNNQDSGDHLTEEFISQIRAFWIVDTMKGIEDRFKFLINDEAYVWADMETSAYPTGWRPAYYGSSSGSLNSSYFYLSSVDGIIADDNMMELKAEAPEGYGVRIFEYDALGNYLGYTGGVNPNLSALTRVVNVIATSGHVYKFTIGRFANNDSPDYNTDVFLSNVKLTIKKVRTGIEQKKARTGEYEFFTVDVTRPLAFGGEEQETSTETIECVLRLPINYSRSGAPTRLVLACHGAHGYIDSSSDHWYNANWKTFMDALLSAGYAVFDANVLPLSAGVSPNNVAGYAVGSPLYVNVLKKAYDYITANYNVTKQIFAHGTSMGGVGATAFSHAYPELVLAESSFAGRDFIRYLPAVADGTVEDRFALAYGYNTAADLIADNFSHAEGEFPSLSLIKYVDGAAQIPPDREADFSGWIAYYTAIANLARDDDAGIWIGKRTVPYKAWNSWADNIGATKLEEILAKAYNTGSACPYYTVAYESGTHTEMSYGQINDMIPQLIAWYKRWE